LEHHFPTSFWTKNKNREFFRRKGMDKKVITRKKETMSNIAFGKSLEGLTDLGRNYLLDRSQIQATVGLYSSGARFLTRLSIEQLLTIVINYPGVPEIIGKFIDRCEAERDSPLVAMLELNLPFKKFRGILNSVKTATFNFYYLADAIQDISLGFSMETKEMLIAISKKALEFLDSQIKDDKSFYLKNVFGEVQKLFNLRDEETKWLYLLQLASEKASPLKDSLDPGSNYIHNNIANYLGISPAQLNDIKSGRLLKLDLIYDNGGNISAGKLLTQIVTKGTESCKELFYEIPTKETLPLTCHLIEQQATNYIKQLLHEGKAPTHILIWGKPGTGKSSYAKSLVQSIKCNPLLIKHGAMSADKDGKTESSIYASIEVALHSPTTKKSICIVDDADSILGTSAGFLVSGETRNRVWLHKLLERPNTKMIWIVNNTRDIDDSIKRRFAFSLFFPPLLIEQKIQVWKNILKRYKAKRFMSDSDIVNWVKKYDVSAGVIDMSVKMIMLNKINTKVDFLNHLEMSLEAHKSLQKNTNKFAKVQRGSDSFIESIGTSTEVPEIIADLIEFDNYLKTNNRKEVLPIRNRSLLFYGVPGAGKSELAKYICEKLNKPLIRKLASDILSMWVGGTEQNIRDAYQEAEQQEGILFIDEADSLLFDRGGAQRSWEVTQVNELLARMEDFVGIQIFATNRMKDLDTASVRRFSHKIKFDYLQPEQVIEFYNQFFEATLSSENKNQLASLHNLVPSDFKTVQDRLFFKKNLSESNIVSELVLESISKQKHSKEGNTIGF
jgi:transitional endoplasmic reticulum ATPase